MIEGAMPADSLIVTERRGTCPVCGVALDGDIRACPRCDTIHHTDCWDWAGGCAIYGCAATEVVARAPESAALLDERPPALPADRLSAQAGLTRGWLDPVPGPLSPYWWATATLLAPLGGIAFLFLPAIPFLFSRVRWRFDADNRVFEYAVTVMGVPVSRRRIPLTDVARLEIRDDEVNLRLVLVLTDGTSLELVPDVTNDPQAWRRLRALARGVQEHTGVHVTSALRMDPTTCEKRLVALKAGFSQVQGRARALARISTATAAGLAAVMVLGGPLPLALPALALLAAGHLGRRAVESADADGSPFLRHGLVRPTALPELERQVQTLQVSGRSVAAYGAGCAALVLTTLLYSGTPLAPIAFVMAAIGSAVSAARWAAVRPLARLLEHAEMGRDDHASDALAATLGQQVDVVRREILVQETATRVSTLRWELECRRRAGFHGFLMMVSAMAFVLAHAMPGTGAMLVELLAGVTALYSAFINVNLLRWGATGRPLPEVEEELEQLGAERRSLRRLPPASKASNENPG